MRLLNRCVIAALLAAAPSLVWSQTPGSDPGVRPQVADSAAHRRPGAVFTGSIASIRSTLPVPMADVRLMWIDSVHADRANPAQPGDVFVDSARSRIAITDSSGTFTVRNLAPGHYLVNVRRIGFSPFEGLLTMDTLPVQMELAMEQVMTILPPIRITEGAINKVTQRLDRVGFVTRSRMGFGARFLQRRDIMDSHATTLQQLLGRQGLSIADSYTVDRIPMDWGELEDYPMDLIVGIEIYRHGLPVEYSMTRSGRNQFANDRGTPITHATVILWTFIP